MAKKNPVKTKVKKPVKVSGVVNLTGEEIRKTNRFFISLRSYGHCDEKGKTVLGIGCSAKKVPAPPDRPLTLITFLLNDVLLPAMRYSSTEMMKKDLKEFKEYVAKLQIN